MGSGPIEGVRIKVRKIEGSDWRVNKTLSRCREEWVKAKPQGLISFTHMKMLGLLWILTLQELVGSFFNLQRTCSGTSILKPICLIQDYQWPKLCVWMTLYPSSLKSVTSILIIRFLVTRLILPSSPKETGFPQSKNTFTSQATQSVEIFHPHLKYHQTPALGVE